MAAFAVENVHETLRELQASRECLLGSCEEINAILEEVEGALHTDPESISCMQQIKTTLADVPKTVDHIGSLEVALRHALQQFDAIIRELAELECSETEDGIQWQ